ncbi:hypothetical protein ACFL6P_03995 [Candidatus Latescibacterota bacterium]
MIQQKSLKMYLLFFFIGYVTFVPIGPYPVKVFGAKLDHLFAYGTVILCVLPFSYRFPKRLLFVNISVLLFLVSSLISSLTSVDPVFSLKAFMVSMGYATITLLVPVFIHEHVSLLRRYLLIVAVITAFIIILLHIYFDFMRIRLHSEVDQNMTSIGLLLCIIFFLPDYFKERKKTKFGTWFTIVSTISFIIIIMAVVLFQSRTAMISFVSAIVWGLFCVRQKIKRHYIQQILKQITIIILIMILGLVCINKIKPAAIESYIYRYSIIIDGDLTENEYARIMGAKNSMELWSKNIKNFVLGDGFFTINPHNEFFRMLGGSGLIGFLFFSLMFIAFYVTFCRLRTAKSIHLFVQNALFAYLFVMVQFYGHTKSLWVGFTFLFINHLAQNKHQRKIIIRRTQQLKVAQERNSIA